MMARLRIWLLAGFAVLVGVGALRAQEEADPPAILVADQVFITADRQLIAEGNVEAYQGDVRLSARRITFDRENGKLMIEGPIRIDQGGTITVLANAAEMDRGLQNGLLTGARMVFDQQLQLAALQMTRVGGRYTQLYKTAVTSCHVCEDGRPPLWQIRARKVTHDQLERQLYFEDAQFRILDVPVFYFPGMRLPDPTLERATGFLIPSVRTTSQLSTGIKIPYFFRLGDHKDLTLSPYLSSKTRTLEYRYRQAFRLGGIEFEGAYTRDDLIPGEDRGYLFGLGSFGLGNDFTLDFDLKAVSDDAYLADYGLPDLDRLRSQIGLTRVKRDVAFAAALTHFKSLRDGENDATLPTSVADLYYQQRFFPQGIGGEVRLGLNAHGHNRTSQQDVLGRDIGRATLDAEWLRSGIFGPGIRADWRMGLSVDKFAIYDDSNYPPEVTVTTPRAALALSYPMTRTTARGATHYLEPVVQLGWSNVHGGSVPNDESAFVEFDQGNLLALSRFPSVDRREDGPTLVYGLNWSRYGPGGWQALATIGQVFRKTADANFTETSGLSGTSSDLLLAGQLKLDKGLSLTGRALLNGDLSFSKVAMRGDWTNARSSIAGSYLWLGTDPAEGRTDPLSELWFDGSYRVNDRWTASANLRYDISDERATRAGVGLIYQNECVTVDLSLNRRYTSSTSVEPSTDFGFTIALSGFAVESGTANYRRTCGKS
ncbi:LPS assembly protein LptD [Seohaeicola saemankumensis]|nr:LPS assembly protein LptD [Seohaeicola saemankumensis]MCA0872036.1 LPS assembly protein LptD [Seohaeicola saemankumensis]